MKESFLLVFASFLSVVSLPIIIVGLIVAVAVVVGVIFLMRSGNKNKGAATGSSADWQRQAQPGAWNQQGGWGQQGQWGAANGAAQAGSWAGAPQNPWGAPAAQQQQSVNPWGAPAAQQQQPANPWGAPAEQQQQPANPWGAPAAQQQQSANPWGAPAEQQQQPANPWGAPAEQQQQPANPWGAPAAQQQQSANPWGAPAAQQQQSANPWEAAPAAAPPAMPSQDPWAQQQSAASQQPAWGMQANTSAPVQQGQQGATAFGGGNPSPAGWGQPQQADPWGGQAASPVAQSAGLQAGGSAGFSSWQQGSAGGPGVGGEADKTVLRSAGQTGPQNSVGYVQVKEGKEPGRIYEIRKESLSIGRSRESDIFLEDLAVSRLHASIVNMGNGAYSLKDEGSANGTKVNDQLVDKFKTYPLQEGDQIQLGQTVLVFARH